MFLSHLGHERDDGALFGRLPIDAQAFCNQAPWRSKVGYALHTSGTDILVNLVDTHLRFDRNSTVRTHGRTCCTLDTGLKLCGLLLEVPCEPFHILLWIDDCEAQRCTHLRRLDDQRGPVLVWPAFEVNFA